MRIIPLSVLAFVGTTALASDALAATCDALYLDDEAQDVIIGEAGYEACAGGPSPFCYFQPYLIGGPKLGVCWRDAGGSWQMEVLDCTDDNTSGDLFFLSTAGGDDRVAILREEFTIGDFSLLSAGANTGAMYCGPNGDALAGFHPDFDFQIYAYLGEGTDVYQGSDNRDVAWTNGPVYIDGTWTSPADNGVDKVCTYAGNDTIYGDGDDLWTVAEDWMDAGDGVDFCDGDYGVDGSDNDDLWLGCETHYDALSDASLGWIDCTEDDDPLHEW